MLKAMMPVFGLLLTAGAVAADLHVTPAPCPARIDVPFVPGEAVKVPVALTEPRLVRALTARLLYAPDQLRMVGISGGPPYQCRIRTDEAVPGALTVAVECDGPTAIMPETPWLTLEFEVSDRGASYVTGWECQASDGGPWTSCAIRDVRLRLR